MLMMVYLSLKKYSNLSRNIYDAQDLKEDELLERNEELKSYDIKGKISSTSFHVLSDDIDLKHFFICR